MKNLNNIIEEIIQEQESQKRKIMSWDLTRFKVDNIWSKQGLKPYRVNLNPDETFGIQEVTKIPKVHTDPEVIYLLTEDEVNKINEMVTKIDVIISKHKQQIETLMKLIPSFIEYNVLKIK
jgi:hypothetical protein